jgi:hypothetical protein
MLEILLQGLLWVAALAGAFIVVRGYWFEAPEVRKPVIFAGLVMCSVSVAQLLLHEGGAWRWPALAFILAVMIAVLFMTPRSVWLKLRWAVVGGIGAIGGLLVATWLSDQMSPVVRATMLAFVAGMTVLFLVSMLRVTWTALRSTL